MGVQAICARLDFFIPGGQSRWLEVTTTVVRQWFNGFNDVNAMSLLLHLVTSLAINQTQPTWCNESGNGKLLLRHVGMKPHGRNVFFPFEGKILQVIKKLSAATIPRGQRWELAGGWRATVDACVQGFALELRHPICHVYPQYCAPPSLLPLATARNENISIIYSFCCFPKYCESLLWWVIADSSKEFPKGRKHEQQWHWTTVLLFESFSTTIKFLFHFKIVFKTFFCFLIMFAPQCFLIFHTDFKPGLATALIQLFICWPIAHHHIPDEKWKIVWDLRSVVVWGE